MLRTFWDISTSLFWRADERGSDYFPTQVCFNMNMHIIHMLLDCRLQTHSLRSFEFVQWDIMSKSIHLNWGFCKKRLETATTKQTRRTLRACAKPRYGPLKLLCACATEELFAVVNTTTICCARALFHPTHITVRGTALSRQCGFQLRAARTFKGWQIT